jgi:DNA (cytosine-5)-methyltransferase 1
MLKLKVASFFSGIGGFDLGFERAGMEIVFQCEINAFCRSVLIKYWPKVPLFGDIHSVLPDNVPDADVWCGGFPCQDLSLANQGKRKGLGGQRSGLFFRFAELLSERRPRWIVIENVPGLLNSKNGTDFQVLLKRLDELGYGIAWRVLDAKYFGTPQRRRRIYIVASLGSLLSAEVLFEQGAITAAYRQGLGKKDINALSSVPDTKVAALYVIQHATIGRKHTAGPQAKGYRNDGESYTLDSRGSGDAVCQTVDPFGIRASTGLSGRMDSIRYRAIGNAVAIPVIEWIGNRIIEVDQSSYAYSGISMGTPVSVTNLPLKI